MNMPFDDIFIKFISYGVDRISTWRLEAIIQFDWLIFEVLMFRLPIHTYFMDYKVK